MEVYSTVDGSVERKNVRMSIKRVTKNKWKIALTISTLLWRNEKKMSYHKWNNKAENHW